MLALVAGLTAVAASLARTEPGSSSSATQTATTQSVPAEPTAPPTTSSPATSTGPEKRQATIEPLLAQDSKPHSVGVISTEHIAGAVEEWWAEEYPRVFAEPYEPLDGGVVKASRDMAPIPCGDTYVTYEVVQNNAVYCSESDVIVVDEERLFGGLRSTFGDASVAMVVAHEWGHAIQKRRGEIDTGTGSSVFVELQADCYAGAWLRHAFDDGIRAGGTVVNFSETDLVLAVQGAATLSDPLGAVSVEPGAHGSGTDRALAVKRGFTESVESCSRIVKEQPKTFQLPWANFDDVLAEGNLPLELLLPAVAEGLSAYAAPAVVSVLTDVDASAGCGGDRLARWCAQEGAVVVNMKLAKQVLDRHGDFAVAFRVAQAWGEHVGVGPSCAAAAWTRWLFIETLSSGSQFSLSPGDVDEALAAALASGNEDLDVDSFFARLDEFENGLRSGVCAGGVFEGDAVSATSSPQSNT